MIMDCNESIYLYLKKKQLGNEIIRKVKHVSLAKQRPICFNVNKKFDLYIKFLIFFFFSAFITSEIDDNGLQMNHF